MAKRPRFSKQDYELVAGLLWEQGGVPELAEKFAEVFEKDNPNFDRRRWDHAIKTGEMFPRTTTKRAKEVLGEAN